MNIPKIINYCWFGRKPLPNLAKKCIESWKKFCPEYKIIEWNEDNFDINICTYTQQAYEAQKYAFVADYARFYILFNFGGIYFDTDVELIKSIDTIIEKGSFMGLEQNYNEKNITNSLKVTPGLGIAANPGLGIAANPGLSIYQEMLDLYSKKKFINENGSLDLTTIVEYTTDILIKHGLKNKSGIQQIDNIYIYPKEYFCPIDYRTGKKNFTENTYSIHHYMASWHSKKEIFSLNLEKFIGKKNINRLIKLKNKIKGIET